MDEFLNVCRVKLYKSKDEISSLFIKLKVFVIYMGGPHSGSFMKEIKVTCFLYSPSLKVQHIDGRICIHLM